MNDFDLRSTRAQPKEVPKFPPDHGRLLRVAVGLAHFTPDEQAWLQDNPRWLRYFEDLCTAWRTCQEHADSEPILAAFGPSDSTFDI